MRDRDTTKLYGLSLEAVARLLGVSRERVRRWVRGERGRARYARPEDRRDAFDIDSRRFS